MHPDLLEMGRMRVLLAIALLGLGIAGTAARAADLPSGHAGFHSAGYFEQGERAGMVLVTGYELGVGIRAYWRAPWRHHHYFPATGKRPRIGRDEHLSATGPRPRPAQTFRRTWSNAAALEHERPIYMLPPDARPAPRPAPPHSPD
jgi:hypothetical protein